MLSNLGLVQYQYISLAIFGAIAIALVVVCVVLLNKLFGNKIVRSANKQIAYMNMDDDSDECTVEGISLLAKRKYLVSNDNKVKPQVYTLITTESTTICINHINKEFNKGDTIELNDGDTICSLDENVVLAA
ncbi:MAG: hypothetical protein IJZ29_05610 [Clostridia bacterium]|nr:hypothetical protein [Clostridia bacterium]